MSAIMGGVEERTLVGRALPLFLLGLVGILGLIPLLFGLIPAQLETAGIEVSIPLPLLVALSLIQPTVLMGVAVLVGAALAPRVGLRSYLTEVSPGEAMARLRADLPTAVVAGLLGGGAMLALEILVFAPRLVAELEVMGTASPGRLGALVGGVLYGGIVEEILLRWGLMTLFVWLGWRFLQGREGRPSPAIVWGAILAAALLFAAGHLPATAALVALTPLVVTRALLLNGLGGVVFGWLFARRSLEAAMVGHAMFHVLVALLALL